MCWGYNTYGELGNNDSNGVQSDVPVSVYGLSCGGSAASSDAPLPVWALGLLALMLLIIAYQKLRHVKPAAS